MRRYAKASSLILKMENMNNASKFSINNPGFCKYLDILLLAFILFAIGISAYVFSIGRSLWLDEAMLAYSFSQRDLLNLANGAIEWNQSAPVVYLYIVKIITILFGNSEFTLRLWSFICYILLLVSCYYILKKILSVRFPLLGAAFVANIPFLIYYASEFKPYMSDCLSIMLVLIAYFLYDNKKINPLVLASFFALMIWNSNPSCFFIAGILIYEFVNSAVKKDYSNLKITVFVGLATLTSFTIYYFFWLKPVIDTGYMQKFWAYEKFIFIPRNKVESDYMINMLISYKFEVGIIIFSFFFTFKRKYKKEAKYIHIIYISLFVVLFASALGRYPISERLLLFIYPLCGVILFYSIDKLFSANQKLNISILIISLLIVYAAGGITQYIKKENAYRRGEEVNPAIDYVEKNIKEGENVYVYYGDVPAFLYRTKYDKGYPLLKNHHVKFEKYWNTCSEDIDYILSDSSVYILTPCIDAQDKRMISISFLIDPLQNRGKVKMVYNEHGTAVYHYTAEQATTNAF
jgi:hypothetical protein